MRISYLSGAVIIVCVGIVSCTCLFSENSFMSTEQAMEWICNSINKSDKIGLEEKRVYDDFTTYTAYKYKDAGFDNNTQVLYYTEIYTKKYIDKTDKLLSEEYKEYKYSIKLADVLSVNEGEGFDFIYIIPKDSANNFRCNNKAVKSDKTIIYMQYSETEKFYATSKRALSLLN